MKHLILWLSLIPFSFNCYSQSVIDTNKIEGNWVSNPNVSTLVFYKTTKNNLVLTEFESKEGEQLKIVYLKKYKYKIVVKTICVSTGWTVISTYELFKDVLICHVDGPINDVIVYKKVN